MLSRLCAFRRFGDIGSEPLSGPDQVLQCLVIYSAIVPDVFYDLRGSLDPVADHVYMPGSALCAFDVGHPHDLISFFSICFSESCVEFLEYLLRFFYVLRAAIPCECKRPHEVALCEVGADHPLGLFLFPPLVLPADRCRRRLRFFPPLFARCPVSG